MFKNLKKRSEGFTIIEVLIVLAIAGLILLIVFLAVPALQRNSRNTQRKNDVAALMGSITEYSTNNNGLVPSSANQPTNTGGTVTWVVTAPATVSSQAKVGYYNAGVGTGSGQITLAANGTTTAAGTLDSAAEDYVIIAPRTECSGAASIAGSARSVTAVYEIESGNGTYAQVCQTL